MSTTPPKTILVTGCSANGIGAAIANALAKQGHHVYATARNTSKIPANLELAPFDVSVISIMVGTITTPFHANEPTVVLPPSSRYAAIRDTISRWATGEAGPKGSSSEDFAESLVQDIVGTGKSAWVWKGAYSGTIKFASKWIPTWILDGLMSTGQGLDELSKNLKK
ncbi:NADPH-dependent 1-acyldihydroxyacetone phosphate reductase [Madurella mycetomatis]|uniref:NADPH-dependent 1-acyldihydroxyacetone phosphate reductase n=1 Tax=Madurella mycetomatis TaxID=100816 RepID=A0A175VXA8_9PEZI|nr:NADPH-dependent 1-acyldihydroxyacetone phosphate reductase [Madurella mycetomatis]